MEMPSALQQPTHLTFRRSAHILRNPQDRHLPYTLGAIGVGILGYVRVREMMGQHHGDGKQPSWTQEHCV